MTLRTLYRRAAFTHRLHDRAKARMEALSLITMRRADAGKPWYDWRGPAKRIVYVVHVRKALAETTRFEARDRMLFDPHEEKEVAKRLEDVRKYAMDRKRGMS